MDGSGHSGWSKHFALDPISPTDPVQFGRFKVLGRLGSGNLGDSYLAASGEELAVVKAVRPNTGNMLRLREQMTRELAAIQGIDSPYLAGVLAADVNAERPWFARQYVMGVTLERWVSEHGPLTPSSQLSLAGQLALGLQDLHAAGVVHRDLRPANVLLSPQAPCLVDFGIVDMPEPGRLTQIRTALRTRVWMAPEQVAGQPATPATDVHAWALVVMFAATGRSPFLAAKASAAVIHPRLPKETPRELAALVDAALVRNPAKRPTAAEIVTTLDTAPFASDGVAATAIDQPPELPGSQVSPLPRQPSVPDNAPAWLPASGRASAGFSNGAGARPAHPEHVPHRPKPALRTMQLVVGGALAMSGLAAVLLMVALRHEPMPTPSVAASFRPTSQASYAPDAGIPASTGSPQGLPGAAQSGPGQVVTLAPAIDPTGDWTGSAVRSDGRHTYAVRLELRGDPSQPTGTVRLRNIVSNNEGSWVVSGSWRDGQLRLEPGVWLSQPNSSWARETLIMVALSDTRLAGTTSDPGDPGYPTGNVDLYR